MNPVDLLGDLVNNLNTLRTRTTDPAARTALRGQADRLYSVYRSAVERKLDENTREYKNAAGILQEAVTQSQIAIRDLSKDVNLIQKVADLANQVEKAIRTVVPMLGEGN